MKEAQSHGNFVCTRSEPIQELNATLIELTHRPSGAKVLHIANDDQENVFCLSFQTLPESSNGAPHILEHTVLCGSKKYPVKDPFFSMNRRSLNTYMNALTGQDMTCYPCATQVKKDFYNLLGVYLDAVFFPELKELSFRQEGHRYDFDEERLVYKGIVFNEMKGAVASPESRVWHKVNEMLLSDTPYAFNSGGEPSDIPNLSYDEFLAFHKTFYHPSRCLFYFYGNLPLEGHLDYLEKNVLHSAELKPPLSPIAFQRRFSEEIRLKDTYPTSESDLEGKTFVALGWLTARIQEQEDILGLSLLESTLMDTDASPLKRRLLGSGLCTHADGFMDSEMHEVPYLLFCRGVKSEDAEKIEGFVRKSLEEIANEGIDPELIASSLHQLEMERLEISGGSTPFGLTLFFRAGLLKQHGIDPLRGLQLHTLFDQIEEKLKDPNYLTGLLRKYFLDNRHFVQLVMEPDPKRGEQEEMEEKARLKVIEKQLTDEQKEQIRAQAKALQELQEKQEDQDINCLPKVDLKDVDPKARSFPLKEEKCGELTVYSHECFTNGLVYAQLVFDTPALTSEELPYFTLFTKILTELGCGNRDFSQNLQLHESVTGGVWAASSLNVQFDAPSLMRPSFSLSSKALSRNSEKMLQLMLETAREVRFDEKERIKELVMQMYTGLQSKVQSSPLNYALSLATAGCSPSGSIKEKSFGLHFYQFIESLATNFDAKAENLLTKLQELKSRVFHFHNPHLILSCDEQDFTKLKEKEFCGLGNVAAQSFASWETENELLDITSQGRAIASPVAFTGWGFRTITTTNPDAPLLLLIPKLMENKTLHKTIREQGGAYGSGAGYNPLTGHFTCFGYRDPHLQNTLKAFNKSIEEIAKGHFNENDLEEAKLLLLQNLDTPITPSSRASAEYFALREGKTPTRRQEWRDRILSANIKEIARAAKEHLLTKKENAVYTSFAAKELLTKEQTTSLNLKDPI